jgi:hypothetical protein
MRSAPPIITESMMFPYLRGLVFFAKLANDGGWKAIDEAYAEPPVSTEQILHPEKYRLHRDLPMVVDLGPLEPGEGWKEVGRNVMGEMQLGVLLRRQDGKAAAAGWDGDRYAIFEKPDGSLALAWFSTWDSENDASEFARNYLKYQTGRLGSGTARPGRDTETLTRVHEGAAFAVERRGANVAVVEGFDTETTARLIALLFHQAKASELNPAAGVPTEDRPEKHNAGAKDAPAEDQASSSN